MRLMLYPVSYVQYGGPRSQIFGFLVWQLWCLIIKFSYGWFYTNSLNVFIIIFFICVVLPTQNVQICWEVHVCEDNALCALMKLKCIHGHSPEKCSKPLSSVNDESSVMCWKWPDDIFDIYHNRGEVSKMIAWLKRSVAV